MSTNKVYGDRPNTIAAQGAGDALGLRRSGLSRRHRRGLVRSTRCKHSLFGASKVAADVMVQEYGRYFGMPTCCLRGGCLTGPNHSGVELHGFLSYLIKCNVEGREYKVFGYKGKQVRDNIHSEDVARFMYAFCAGPARRRGLQPRRRQGELLLDPRGVRLAEADHRQGDDLALRGREPRSATTSATTAIFARCGPTIRTGTSPSPWPDFRGDRGAPGCSACRAS